LTAPISADAEDAAIEREDDDALAGEDALLAREVAAVTAAIARIDEGSYGICTSCGKDIAAERLVAKPEAA
ncbi:MAG TPA: TraR/DksA C4-type zinc finger protein, partial [Sphingopyxis terrae]|nr:TraR/DksA C4-type zinc finger protein [Sphingopyxis terrae]